MRSKILTYLVVTFAAVAAFSCSKKPFDVERVAVPAGREFNLCLDKELPGEKPYFYYIQFITKEKMRYTRDGVLNQQASGTCYTESKFKHNMSAYADETVSLIERISNQTLDTCVVRIYTNSNLGDGTMVLEKIFTGDDLK